MQEGFTGKMGEEWLPVEASALWGPADGPMWLE